MNEQERLLKPSDLPGSLWDRSAELLSLPPALAAAYEKLIDRHNLRELAMYRVENDPPVGGLTQELTDKHYAQAFDGSCARIELALLDPMNVVPHASNAFISCLAGNATSLTDAPCGAGAAAFSFLATVAELREKKVLPRNELNISLIGAELSEAARVYAQEMLEELRPTLESQAIFVHAEWMAWDVTCSLSNTDLIRKMTIVAEGKSNRLFVIANFNGFLEKGGKKKVALPQLNELFRHASGENSMALWIEPDMNSATVGLFPWLKDLLKGAWQLFARETLHETTTPSAVSRSRFRLPLAPERKVRVGLSVMAIELRREK